MCVNDTYSNDLVLYRGKNAVYKFIQCIFKEYSYCKNVRRKHFNKWLVMTASQNEEFERSNICSICGKLIDIGDNKVRDHDHTKSSNNCRGPAHWSCNINLKISKKLVVIFHNLRVYGSQLIFKELNKFTCSVGVVPNGLEKYMSFTLGKNIVFIDSMLFMNSSLDKLARNLSTEFSGGKLELVKKKGVYPYEYFDSFGKFGENKLPSIDCFFSSIKHRGISKEEYERACDVWKVSELKNLGEYHDLYLKCDVLLLCDVFEKFINVCLRDYGLDCCHYFGTPGFSWDAINTGIKLEKIDNTNVHLFLEKGMSGGVSYISKRYSKSDENTDIVLWDMNSFYGTIMSFDYLPYGGFKFLSEEENKRFDLDSIPENSLIGYILEVDLEYPHSLHDIHNGYPLCPEKLKVTYNMLSGGCKEIADWYDIKVGGVKILIPNLSDKVEYVVHYRNLKYYMSLGV